MADGPSGEAKSGQQKPLPFNFRTPLLELSKDNSKARITWNCQGHVLQDHREHIVASVDRNNRTQLSSPWSLRSEAERKLQTLLADLGNGTSWLNMYKKTAKVCEEVQDMPFVVVNTYDFGTDQKLPHHMDQSCVYYQDDHGDDDADQQVCLDALRVVFLHPDYRYSYNSYVVGRGCVWSTLRRQIRGLNATTAEWYAE